ncbi:MAG: hypothetical protein ACK5X9_10645 [Alphaproteobacteria bacterium]
MSDPLPSYWLLPERHSVFQEASPFTRDGQTPDIAATLPRLMLACAVERWAIELDAIGNDR